MKLKFLFFFLLLVKFSPGQLTKGVWLAGGSGSFYSYSDDYNSDTYSTTAHYTKIDVSVNIGYFVADRLAFGLRPSFSSYKGEVTSPGGMGTNTRRYGFGPFGRFYFLKCDKPFNILSEISYQYGLTTLDNRKVGHFDSFSASSGPALYFNNCIAMELLVGYSHSSEVADQAMTIQQKGLRCSIGFQIHLEK